MENKQIKSEQITDDFELLGDGQTFLTTICNMLTGIKGFEIFPHKDITHMAQNLTAYFVGAGTTIIRESEINNYLFILVQGKVGVYKEDANHEQKLLSSISQGRVFGEISLIDNFPSSASIVAESNATFLIMTREWFFQCVESKTELGVRLLSYISRMLCARLRASSGQLVEYIEI